MTTFSQLVSNVAERSGQAQYETISGFLNQTIRELESIKFYHKNLIEDQIPVDVDPFIWQYPLQLQYLRTVRYSNGIYPDFLSPGKRQADEYYLYYAANNYFVFKGCGENQMMDVSYYRFSPRLMWYDPGKRPAEFNISGTVSPSGELEYVWTYTDLSGESSPPNLDYTLEANQLAARTLTQSWLIRDWPELVTEGTLSKLYKSRADTERAATHYSFFQQQKNDQFMQTEMFETLGS